MKVIVAGLPKTGTKSVNAALKHLGYNVYDFIENYTYLKKDWEKICLEGGNTEDFRRMFENVDAVTDVPSCYFWDEIHKAFPDAKIILTVRSSEEEWSRSTEKQLAAGGVLSLRIMSLVTPTLRSINKFANMIVTTTFGTSARYSLFRKPHLNKLLFLMTYRRHNSYVIQTAPEDKLLVFNAKEGWEPLCKFLGVEVPKEPFPHKNVRGNLIKEMMAKEPAFIRAKKEGEIIVCVAGALLLFGAYKLVRGSHSAWVASIFSPFKNLFVKASSF